MAFLGDNDDETHDQLEALDVHAEGLSVQEIIQSVSAEAERPQEDGEDALPENASQDESKTIQNEEQDAVALGGAEKEQPDPIAPTETSEASSAEAEAERQQRRQSLKHSYQERLNQYKTAIEEGDVIDLQLVRKMAKQGIPEAHGLRATYWKVLLDYLPRKRSLWESELARNRSIYHEWVRDLMLDPHAKYSQGQGAEAVEDVTTFDHPLSQSDDSVWKAFFKDKQMQEEIDKDVKRTFPHLHFFNKDIDAGSIIHYEALRRILFIYAKLNPGVRYVQGMNEIVGPIYYVFAINAEHAEHAEADAFHCFKNVMAEIMDNFIKSLDHDSSLGISYRMKRLNNLLKSLDFELWQHLESLNMNPQFYSFRWLTLLLSQEFDLPEVLRLWDALFSDPQRFDFLNFCCISMLHCVRQTLLENDFADNLKLLQNYPKEIEISTIVQVASELEALYIVSTTPSQKIDVPSDPTPVATPTPTPAPVQTTTPSTNPSSSSSSSSSGGGGFWSFFMSTPAKKK